MEPLLKGGIDIDQPIINKPRNLKELKALYQQFSPFLSPDNKKLLLSLIEEMEKGTNLSENKELKKMVKTMQKKVSQAEETLKKNGIKKPL